MESNLSIASVTSTVCQLMGVPFNNRDIKPSFKKIIDAANTTGIKHIQKFLVYAPDAIGLHLYKPYRSYFKSVEKVAPLSVHMSSVDPSVTPVCFASMFTGVSPEIHGIRKYEKPLVQHKTLFDYLIEANKKVAIVAVINSSIDIIFRNRQIDYFSEVYDEDVTRKTIELIKSDKHDFILAYHQEYDDIMHKTHPFSKEAINAMKNHISAFNSLTEVVDKYWSKYDRAVAFTPDHGAHTNSGDGKGTHGKNIPEDMDIQHFFGLAEKNK